MKRFVNRGPEVFGYQVPKERYPWIEIAWVTDGRCPSGKTQVQKAWAITEDGERVPCPIKLANASIGKEV